MKLYITFGQEHVHKISINDEVQILDKDCVAVIECNDYGHGREIAFNLFGPTFATSYEHIDGEKMHYFPRGLIPVNSKEK